MVKYVQFIITAGIFIVFNILGKCWHYIVFHVTLCCHSNNSSSGLIWRIVLKYGFLNRRKMLWIVKFLVWMLFHRHFHSSCHLIYAYIYWMIWPLFYLLQMMTKWKCNLFIQVSAHGLIITFWVLTFNHSTIL